MVDIVVLPMGLQTLAAHSVLSLTSSLGVPMFSLMVSCKNPLLYQYGSGRASEEASISGSCQ